MHFRGTADYGSSSKLAQTCQQSVLLSSRITDANLAVPWIHLLRRDRQSILDLFVGASNRAVVEAPIDDVYESALHTRLLALETELERSPTRLVGRVRSEGGTTLTTLI